MFIFYVEQFCFDWKLEYKMVKKVKKIDVPLPST